MSFLNLSGTIGQKTLVEMSPAKGWAPVWRKANFSDVPPSKRCISCKDGAAILFEDPGKGVATVVFSDSCKGVDAVMFPDPCKDAAVLLTDMVKVAAPAMLTDSGNDVTSIVLATAV
jgi:hypothetical protein